MSRTGPRSVEDRLTDVEAKVRNIRLVFMKHFFLEMDELSQEFEAMQRRISRLDGGAGQSSIDKFERALEMMKLIMGEDKVFGRSPAELLEICHFGTKQSEIEIEKAQFKAEENIG